jgi:hypothetical protein
MTMKKDIPALGFTLNRAGCTFDQLGIYAGAELVALRPISLSQHDWNTLCRYLCGNMSRYPTGPSIAMPVDLEDDAFYERLATITDWPKKDPPEDEITQRRKFSKAAEKNVKIAAPRKIRANNSAPKTNLDVER